MKIGMIGLGRMGANMSRRLMRAGHECVTFDANKQSVDALVAEGAKGAYTIEELVAALPTPRAVWLMVPAAVVESVLETLSRLLTKDDVVSLQVPAGAQLGDRRGPDHPHAGDGADRLPAAVRSALLLGDDRRQQHHRHGAGPRP